MNQDTGEGEDIQGGGGEISQELPEAVGGDDEAQAAWIRDIDEDTGYNILQSARQFPDHIRGLESRVFGKMGPLVDRLNALEKSTSTRTSLDAEKLKAALDNYDATGALSEALLPALQESIQSSPLDENTLRPYLEPLQQQFNSQMGESLVLSHYSPREIADMIPDVADGKWTPQSERHQDFINWYSQQGYEIQQALNNFGPAYIQALRDFERWEAKQLKEREGRAGAKSGRLAAGQQPAAQGRRNKSGPQTPEEAFLAGFNEVD